MAITSILVVRSGRVNLTSEFLFCSKWSLKKFIESLIAFWDFPKYHFNTVTVEGFSKNVEFCIQKNCVFWPFERVSMQLMHLLLGPVCKGIQYWEQNVSNPIKSNTHKLCIMYAPLSIAILDNSCKRHYFTHSAVHYHGKSSSKISAWLIKDL